MNLKDLKVHFKEISSRVVKQVGGKEYVKYEWIEGDERTFGG